MVKYTKVFRLYGINIKTDIELPVYPEESLSDKEMYYIISKGKCLQNEDSFCEYSTNQRGNVIFKKNSKNQYMIETDKMGRVYIDQNTVQYYEDSKDVQMIVEDKEPGFMLSYGMGIAMMLRLNQYAVIHANALQIDNKVILVMGESGAGKSTFCSYLIKKHGAKLISDDMSCIRNGILYSGFQMLKLWPEIISNIMESDKGKYYRVGVSDKRYYTLAQHVEEKHKITDLIFLQSNQEDKLVKIQEIGNGEACAWLIKNIYNKVSLDSNMFLQEMQVLTEMMNTFQINSYLIHSPRTFDTLEKLAQIAVRK